VATVLNPNLASYGHSAMSGVSRLNTIMTGTSNKEKLDTIRVEMSDIMGKKDGNSELH
jgi:hypothetical protein